MSVILYKYNLLSTCIFEPSKQTNKHPFNGLLSRTSWHHFWSTDVILTFWPHLKSFCITGMKYILNIHCTALHIVWTQLVVLVVVDAGLARQWRWTQSQSMTFRTSSLRIRRRFLLSLEFSVNGVHCMSWLVTERFLPRPLLASNSHTKHYTCI